MNEFRPIPARHNIAAGSALPVQIPQELKQCKYVLVKKGGHLPPLTPLYEGPYRVISRSSNTFNVQKGDKEETIAVERLKPCTNKEKMETAQPARQGRPPGSKNKVKVFLNKPTASLRLSAASGPESGGEACRSHIQSKIYAGVDYGCGRMKEYRNGNPGMSLGKYRRLDQENKRQRKIYEHSFHWRS
jgi:hypothetical protein